MTQAYVVVHVAVSLDGATTGFEPDIGVFYELAQTWREDVTLAGADTILAQEDALAVAGELPGPTPGAPLLAVVDGRERVSAWDALHDCGHWSDAVPLRGSGPGERVDLAAALAGLAASRERCTVRVDSGGGLTGALLGAGLVDELSLLVHPCLVPAGAHWYGPEPPPAGTLRTIEASQAGEGLAWLRYAVGASGSTPDSRSSSARLRSSPPP